MKVFCIAIICTLGAATSFAQTTTGKITLAKGQKLSADLNAIVEGNLMGMEISSTTASKMDIEVKDITAATTTMISTLRKLKLDADMGMLGKSQNYDSEKPEDQNSELGKAMGGAINKPSELIIDNTTGKPVAEKKTASPEREDDNSMEGMMQMFGGSNNPGAEGAILLIPQGKKAGDTWADSSVVKDAKTVNTYSITSINGTEAVIHISSVSNGTSEMDSPQGKLSITTASTTTGDIITDINSSLVKSKKMITDMQGNIEMMGQEVPLTSKTTLTVTYK
jgi:hypothetical protein